MHRAVQTWSTAFGRVQSITALVAFTVEPLRI
jgi:hypothetical protein